MMSPGTRIGSYEVTARIGQGGMGEVYRARDTKLGRDVALKILPEAFAADADRLARFQREAHVLASLNHPHIAAIYGLEDGGEHRALVLELVEGPTLADRIAKGSFPLDEALAVARQIIDALEAAHEQGIVHRDLKPANVKLRPDGTVKVLDFGLAKALEGGSSTIAASSAGLGFDSASPAALISPTITSPALMTGAGVILGTAAYMSPEQAKGRAADKRSDIWAFGCVLYEMLTGTRAFAGEDVSDTLAFVLTKEPGWTALPGTVPPSVRRLLRRTLQKDRKQRLADIADARLDLADARSSNEDDPRGVITPRGNGLPWAIAALALIVAATVVTVAWFNRAMPPPPERRVDIVTPPTSDPTSFALSPDGTKIAFVAQGEGGRQLWLRSLDESTARSLSGTEGATYPFWSPDSRSLGFFAGTRLRSLDVDAGAARTLANVITPAGGAWASDGTILYAPNSARGLYPIAAAVSEPAPIPRNAQGNSQRFPHFLPDGRRFLFFQPSAATAGGVYLSELGTESTVRLLDADSPARYASGHLFFVRQSTLFAQAFDPKTAVVTGSPMRVADNVTVGRTTSVPFSVSANGVIAYRARIAPGENRLVWFDRSGKELAIVDDRVRGTNPSLSPDGRRLAVQATVGPTNSDVWLLDLDRNVFTRLTSDPAIDGLPVWSGDGRRILFNSTRSGGQGLYLKPSNESEQERLFLSTSHPTNASDWSPDGRLILYRTLDPTTGAWDILGVAVDEPAKPFDVVRTQYDERDAQFSPDGKWIAYQSDDVGQPEIYVQPFPGPGGKIRVSNAGGTQVRWGRAGKELFYVAGDNRLMAVPIVMDGDKMNVGTPSALFQTRLPALVGILRQQYVVSADGQRFLMNVLTDEASTAPITLILNWKP